MAITKELFGTLPNGQDITAYLLDNGNGVSARILNYGGTEKQIFISRIIAEKLYRIRPWQTLKPICQHSEQLLQPLKQCTKTYINILSCGLQCLMYIQLNPLPNYIVINVFYNNSFTFATPFLITIIKSYHCCNCLFNGVISFRSKFSIRNSFHNLH